EGAAYMTALTGDRRLGQELERIAGLVLACQKDDGYINTQVPPNSRFDPKVNHDLYNAGHFFEAAVAHFRATGKRYLLDAAARWADYLIAEYENGNPYFRTVATK
ncbi:MAG: glycoside hydrolase family 127 protein, partial [bacterium]|nr:glycoside hydrolase family 127 protein [bacterium]